MDIIKVLLLLFLTYHHANCESSLSNTILLCHKKYMNTVFQMFINDLEEVGFSKIRMQDFTMKINESMYGLDVIGELEYSNGLVVSIKDSQMKYDSTKHWISNNNLTAHIQSTIILSDITYVYDVVGKLSDITQKATGLYHQKSTDWFVSIEKDLVSEEVDVSITKLATNTNSEERIRFMPVNDYTTIFAGKFQPNSPGVSNGISNWNATFKPILEDIVQKKIKFPEISYDKFVTNDENSECDDDYDDENEQGLEAYIWGDH